MNRYLICLLLPLALGSSLAFATCEADLTAEFSRKPDDSLLGFVTNKIPITPETVLASYSRGIFPWSVNASGNGDWHSPPQRGVLYLRDLDIPRGDRKAIRKLKESGKYRVEVNKNFRQVMAECAEQSRKDSTWITAQHIDAYTRLHEQGHAHSVEVYDGDELVAGLYGVFIGAVFSGESMFHKRSDVLKLAYEYLLVEMLGANQEHGHVFIDVQQVLPGGLNHKWGATNVTRDEYLRLAGFAKEENKSLKLP